MALAERNHQGVRSFLLWRKGAALGLGGLTLSVLIASCGGGGSTRATAGSVSTTIGAAAAPTTAAAGSAAAAPTKGVVISAAQSGRFGTILVGGTTLYTLKPSQTACTAECLRIWPPLLLPQGVGSATAGPGVNASKLGTMAIGGRLQVTYSGQALYWFSGDKAPGQVNGNVTDIWGKWSVVAIGEATAASPASGALVTSTTAASSRNSSSATTASKSTSPPTTAGSSLTSTTTTQAPTTTTTAPTTTTTAPTSGGAAF